MSASDSFSSFVPEWLNEMRIGKTGNVVGLEMALYMSGNDYAKYGTTRDEVVFLLSERIKDWFRIDSLLLRTKVLDRFLNHGYSAEELGIDSSRYEEIKLDINLRADASVSFLKNLTPDHHWQSIDRVICYIDHIVTDGESTYAELGITQDEFAAWYLDLSRRVMKHALNDEADALEWIYRESTHGLGVQSIKPLSASMLDMTASSFEKLYNAGLELVENSDEFRFFLNGPAFPA